MNHQVKIPERDVERREFFGLMLNLPKRAWNRLTTEEMQDIAIKRGLLKEIVREKK